jgi:integrase
MPKTKRSKYSEEDILSQDKIEKALSACKDLEELTIFSHLYEGALRIGEIGTLT